jgi:hypothetical protein
MNLQIDELPVTNRSPIPSKLTRLGLRYFCIITEQNVTNRRKGLKVKEGEDRRNRRQQVRSSEVFG